MSKQDIKKAAEQSADENEPFPNINYRAKHIAAFISGAEFAREIVEEALDFYADHGHNAFTSEHYVRGRKAREALLKLRGSK